MLHHSTKEAIKVALSFTLAISLTFLFGWEKPWWSAVTVIAVSANETYGHSLKLARERLLGTLVGAGLALVLIGAFAQEPFLFIVVYILLGAIATFMSFNQKHGYAFRIAFVVCSIVCAIGNFNDVTSFDLMILRLQETFLGVIVYSVVFSLIWPNTTQKHFFNLQKSVLQSLQEISNQFSQDDCAQKAKKLSSELEQTMAQITKMKTILDLPLSDSHQLNHQLEKWQAVTISSYEITMKLTGMLHSVTNSQVDTTNKKSDLTLIKQQLTTLSMVSKSDAQHPIELALVHDWKDLKKLTQEVPLKNRLIDAAMVMVIIATCFSLWIYIPLITGVMFPLLSAVFAITIMTMPKGLMKHVILSTLILSAIIILQFVFIMPQFTELWQLAAFYFINIFVLWKVCSKPQLALHKILGGNYLVIFTMSALHLTPTYTIETPLNMLIQMFVVLGIIHFFEKISRSLGC